MRHKLASPLALAAAAVVFFGVLFLADTVLWSSVLAIVAAVGVYLMMDDRTAGQVEDDTYADDAQNKVEQVMRMVRAIQQHSKEILDEEARTALESACQYVPELISRIRDTAPTSLYSTASQLGNHLSSVEGVVIRYLDIQRRPNFYRNPESLQHSGKDAFHRFAEFALESVRLVNQGDLAQYQANLDTVAPARLPELG